MLLFVLHCEIFFMFVRGFLRLGGGVFLLRDKENPRYKRICFYSAGFLCFCVVRIKGLEPIPPCKDWHLRAASRQCIYNTSSKVILNPD